MYHANIVTSTAKTLKDFSAYKVEESNEKGIKVKIVKLCKCQDCGKECVEDNEMIINQDFPNTFQQNIFNFNSEVHGMLKQMGLVKLAKLPETIQRKNEKKICSICMLEVE